MSYINKYATEQNDVAIAAGRTGTPQTYTKGGELARGSITFADNPTANDTVTLNGKVIKFSASASDFTTAGSVADPFILNIKASLTLTLDEVATQTNGSANASLSVATYANSGGTILTIVYDTYTSTGNSYTLAASADTASGATLTGGQAKVTLSSATENIELAISDSNDQHYILANESEFTRRTIAMTAKGSGNAVITPASFSSGTTITFNTDGDIWFGIFINGAWKTVASDATVA